MTTNAAWRNEYLARLMSVHEATLRDAQTHFSDIRQLYGIDYSDDPVRVADEEARLFGFPWNDWAPQGSHRV